MSIIKACNNFVFIIRDEVKKEVGGLIVPSSGKVKPYTGTIHAVGNLVTDPDIKKGKGKKALWHQGGGMEIEYEDITYVVLVSDNILSVI